jgi:hypothetical protein
LPAAALRRRFGEAGRAASERAQGLTDRPVIAPMPPPVIEAVYDPEEPLADGPRLDRELSRLAGRLARELTARGQAAARLTLTVTCQSLPAPETPDNPPHYPEAARYPRGHSRPVSTLRPQSRVHAPETRCLHLKQPVAGAPAILARARELLVQIGPDRPISTLRIELADLCAAPTQLSFPIAVGMRAPRQDKLDVVARRLRERFGPSAARRAHLVANALLPEDGVAWEDYGRIPARRPRPIAVRMDEHGQPTALRRGNGPWEAVRAVYAQWRIRANWWAEPTHRRYYRLEIATGIIVEVYHEQRDDSWHLTATRD